MPVLQDLLQLGGGAPPDTSAGPAGSPGQLEQAAGSPSLSAEIGPRQDAPSVSLAGGKEMLPRIDYAVKGVESDNSHTDAQGKIKVSPAGAIGISQLMPDTC